MHKFARRDEMETDEHPITHRVAHHPHRPASAREKQNNHEHRDAYETDTESFDRTRLSNGPEYATSDDLEEELTDKEDDQEDRFYPFHLDNQRLAITVDHLHKADDVERRGVEYKMTQQRAAQQTVATYEAAQQYIPTDVDSYPPTTSGEPTEMDVLRNEDQNEAHGRMSPRVPQLQHPNVSRNQASHRHEIPTQVVVNQHRQKPPAHLKNAFKEPVKQTVNREDLARQQALQARPQISSHNVQRPITEQIANTRQPVAFRNPIAQGVNQIKPTVNNWAASAAHATHQSHPREGLYQEPEAEYAHEEDQDLDNSGIKLDYTSEELYSKDFASLQKDPFDGPDQENAHLTPVNTTNQTLDDKLAAFATRKPEEQRDFFSSLKMEDWEEAGDWFQDRFSDILKSLRESRKQRRQLAAEFEKEISERQKALTMKRKITDDALEEMKKSGSAVLEGTPKKKR